MTVAPTTLPIIRDLRNRLEQRKGERTQTERTIRHLEGSITQARRGRSRYERALEIVKAVGLQTQKQLEYHLAEQVSLALRAVFDNPYELKVDFQEKRGKTEVELLFTRGDLELPPIGNAGGGAVNIASLALRVAYWSMRRDTRVRPLLLLDEPFPQLKGEDANRRALAMVREISQGVGLQIISISDERMPREDITTYSDRVFHVAHRDGVSRVTQV